MTDAELLEAVHVVILAWMKGELSETEAMEKLVWLYEDNGRRFVRSVEQVANDDE